jgi:hypothetical protein
MRNCIERPYLAVASRLDLWCYRARNRAQRLSRAWSYFRGRLGADDAQRILLDCESPAGWHPLLVLTVEDTLEQARETFADHPDLPRLIADGCERVGDKWESYNDELYEARRWAIDLAEHYAAREGIELVRLDEGGALPDVKNADGVPQGGAP